FERVGALVVRRHGALCHVAAVARLTVARRKTAGHSGVAFVAVNLCLTSLELAVFDSARRHRGEYGDMEGARDSPLHLPAHLLCCALADARWRGAGLGLHGRQGDGARWRRPGQACVWSSWHGAASERSRGVSRGAAPPYFTEAYQPLAVGPVAIRAATESRAAKPSDRVTRCAATTGL